jgi:hypothetical protein
MNALYPGGRSDAELRAIRQKADADCRAIHERWRKEAAEKERKAREAANAIEAAKRKAEADAKSEAELAEVTALVSDPVALVRLVLSLKADLSKRVGALEDKRDRRPIADGPGDPWALSSASRGVGVEHPF